MSTTRYKCVSETLRSTDFLNIESGERPVVTARIRNIEHTGVIVGIARKGPPHYALPKDAQPRAGDLYRLEWSEPTGNASESLITHEPKNNDQADPEIIELEFAGEWFTFQKTAIAKATASEGPALTFMVRFHYGPPKRDTDTTDHQGRRLVHNTEMDFTPEDIMKLALRYDVGISKNTLSLSPIGKGWGQR